MNMTPCSSLADFHRNVQRICADPTPPRRFDALGEFRDCTVHVNRGAITRVLGHLGSQRFEWRFADAKDGDSIEARLFRAAKEALDA